MDVKEVRRFSGVSPRIVLEPSHETGIFVGNNGRDAHVARILMLSGVSLEDVDAIETGDTARLTGYLQVDDDQPGVYRLVGCRAALRLNAHTEIAVTDDVVREFAPVPAS